MVMRYVSIALLALAALWFGFFFSGYAVLVGQDGPRRMASDNADSLSCTYFSGADKYTLSFTYTPEGTMDKPSCPYWDKN